jgi:hypothetical protein
MYYDLVRYIENMRAGLIVLCLCRLVSAQTTIDASRVQLFLGQFRGAQRPTLECDVRPIRPALGFSMRFEAGYTLTLPLSQYSGPGHSLKSVVRIAPKGENSAPVFLADSYRLAAIPPTKLNAEFGGGFFVGEGHYLASLILLDDSGRSCTKNWEIDAELPRGSAMKLVIRPNSISELSLAAVRRARSSPGGRLRLTILMDAAPLAGSAGSDEPGLNAIDRVFLLGSLSALLENLPVSSTRLVVFNLEQQRELFRRDDFTLSLLGDVAAALNQVQLSTVDYRSLQPAGRARLLWEMMDRELSDPDPSNAVVFLGPRERYHDNLLSQPQRRGRGPAPHFFFLVHMVSLKLADQERPAAIQPPRGPGRGLQLPLEIPQPGVTRPISEGEVYPGAVGAVIPASPTGAGSDSVSLAVRKLGGRVMEIRTPADLGKSVKEIQRVSGR